MTQWNEDSSQDNSLGGVIGRALGGLIVTGVGAAYRRFRDRKNPGAAEDSAAAPGNRQQGRRAGRTGPLPIADYQLPMLFQRRDHRRHDLEQIAHDPVIGDFENRRLGVLVNRDDRPRAFHADDVLNRARDAER